MNEKRSSLIITSPSFIYGSCSYASTGIGITAKSSIPVLLYNVGDSYCYLPQPWKCQSQNPMEKKIKKSVFKPVFVHEKFPSLCQQLDWLSHPLRHHTKQTIAPSKRLKSRMHDSTRLLKWVLLSPWGFPHQPQRRRSSQLLDVCCPLEADIDLVADAEIDRHTFFFFPSPQDRCLAVFCWPVDLGCC